VSAGADARIFCEDSHEVGRDGRTTATLLGSLAGRLGALFAVSGADAIGAQIAGFAAVGRQVSATAEGARMRAQLERSRGGINGEAIWQRLQIDEWLSAAPPSPVLEDLANDLALLLSTDLHDALHALDRGTLPIPRAEVPEPERVHVLDSLIGLWAVGRQLAAAVEALVAGAEAAPRLTSPPDVGLDEGGLLR
jgi:hypothetical protein